MLDFYVECRIESGESSPKLEGPSSMTELDEHNDRWYVVWPVYAGIFGPMALYVFHDVIDSRWRRRGDSIAWYWAYFSANVVFIPAFGVYFAAQIGGANADHKEAAAALVAMLVNLHTLMKIFRGLMMLQTTMVLAQRFGLARPFQPRGARHIWAYGEYVGDLVAKNASCLLDDDSPGDGARVAWWRLIWAVLRRTPWRKLHVHKPDAGSGFAHLIKGPVLQDAKDLIIMTDVWVWGCLSQVCICFSPAHQHPTSQVVLAPDPAAWSCKDLHPVAAV